MLKEDYDFTCQHIELHGAAVRLNRLFVKALHRVNPGGAVADRSSSKVGWVDRRAKAKHKLSCLTLFSEVVYMVCPLVVACAGS